MPVHPRRSRAVVAAAASLAIAGLLSPASALAVTPHEVPTAPGTVTPSAEGESLIISEYVEGSSFNKALEIYNAGTTTVDLTGYQIQGYQNGSDSAGYTAALEGSLAPGEVFVVAHPDWTLDYVPDAPANLQFNGDDAVVLSTTSGVVVDSLGQVGVDPGTRWGTPPTTTLDTTLVRNTDVCVGDTVIDDAFDPATQFSGLPQNDITNLGTHTATCVPAGPVEPVINEFSTDTATPGDDVEFLEVYGEPDTDYAHLSIVQVEGDGTSTSRGSIISGDDVGTTDAAGFWSVNLPANRIQNGTLTLLLVEGYTNQKVIDADRDGVIDEGTGLTVVDSVAIADENTGDLIYSETALVSEFDGAANAPGGASRIPDGTDTNTTEDWVRNDFNKAGFPGFQDVVPAPGQAWNTPGAPNEAYEEEPPPPGGECGDPVMTIGAVQGPGAASPVVNTVVSVEGTVFADFQDGSFQGFYVQDAGDENAATSDGIFVYTPSGPEVAVGDEVRVTGTVTEFFTLTQISGATIAVCATGTDLPSPTELAFPLSAEDLESVESMHITFPETLSILEYFEYSRYGEVVIGTGLNTPRQFQPSAVADPGSAEAIAEGDWNASHRITLDDHENGQNPANLRHPAGGQFTLDHLFRGGDTLTGVTGVIDFRFDEWKVQPTQDATFNAVNPRPATAPEVGEGSLTVASFNVLNYFTDLDGRGADTPEEFDRQESKIVAAMAELDADVLGLIEIENNDDVAVSTLTDALNDVVGADAYDYVATGTIGTDEITTAFIFKPSEVTPVGGFATLTSADDPLFRDDFNRPTLAQTFEENATGETVTVAVNHLKSKGSSCDAVGDPEDPWAGNCNGVRTDAATAMVAWLASDPTETGSENTLIIGDINSYDKEDPIDVFAAGGYSDLLLEHQGEHEYSYVFDGQLGYLDYALANESLASKITGAAGWKINADEPSVLDYDMSFKPDEQDALFEPNAYRSSDHDPVLIGVDLDGITDPEPVVVDRIAGKNRYATSADVAAKFGDVGTVYLASGQEFPDALTGTAPAVRDGAPVLLTRSGSLPNAAEGALGTLKPEQVYALGGAGAISDDVLAEVEALTGAEVVRIAGSHRYATAAAVAQTRFTAADVDTVYVAAGVDFADSLAAGPLAGLEDDPILLTKPGNLPGATIAALRTLDPDHIVVLGGEGAISDVVYTELGDYADTIERVAGADRYETAALVADRIAPSEAGFVASGAAFPDALSGAAWAGHEASPLLLTRPDQLSAAAGEALVERAPATVTIFGGEGAVAESVRLAIEELLNP